MSRCRWGWLEAFVITLFLLNGLLLLPGAQALRFVIRAAPYAASLLALIWSLHRNRAALRMPGAAWLVLVLGLLVANLLHPATQPFSGVAQCLQQLAIAAPVFWCPPLIDGERRLERLLRLVYFANAIGAFVGLLQIYDPQHFLPAQFSTNASETWIGSLMFVGPGGHLMVRPPGLSDLPGGAAIAAFLTAIFAIAFGARKGTRVWLRLVHAVAAAVGISVLYLTQVRSLAIMTAVCLALLFLLSLKRQITWNRTWLAASTLCLMLGAFTYAVAVGGQTVRERFIRLAGTGLLETLDSSRGWHWRWTFDEGLKQYPFGAGLGRWGMVSTYFADRTLPDAEPLWAEIQLTGWLYDGGVPLWLLYGSALIASMLFLLRTACVSPSPSLTFAAALVFCVNFGIIGQVFSGPCFNTPLGLKYWLFAAIVWGAYRNVSRQRRSRATVQP